MVIKIYSTKQCPYCKNAKKFFKENNIKFINYDVGEDKDKAEEMIKISGQKGVPVIVINKEIIVGFEKEKIKDLLKFNDDKKNNKIKDDNNQKLYDTIIIGAGPAGATAAIYLGRRKRKVLVLYEKMGGQAALTDEIQNYTGFKMISGEEFTKRLKQHIKKYDIECRQERFIDSTKSKNIFKIKTQKNEYKSRSVIIATGAKPISLGIPGEKEFIGKGVAYCATCDAPLYKNKIVAVIGGGNSALGSCIQLNEYAKKIYLITINNELEGEDILIDKVKKIKNLDIIYKTKTKKILGKKFVNNITIEKNKKIKNLKVDGVFIEIGYSANSNMLKLKKSKNHEVRINEKCETNIKGVFAAGDVTSVPYNQIIIAAGEGATASLSCADFLDKLE